MRRSTLVLGWTSWGIASVFYLFETVLRVATGVMADDLRSSFDLMSTQLGFVASSYYYAYTPLQIPCGIILDKIGVRKLVGISALLCTLGSYLFAISPNVAVACGGRFLIGAGSACAFIGCLKLASGWFTRRTFALFAGLTNMMGCLGGVFAGEPVALRISTVGWRQTMIELSMIGAVVMVLCWFFIKDPVARKSLAPAKPTFLLVVSKGQIWLSGLIGGLMYLPVTAFAELWGTPFLVATYGISKEQASFVSMALFLGTAFGGPLMAYYVAWLNSYKRALLSTSLSVGSLFFYIAAATFVPFWSVLLCAFLAGIFLGGQVLVFSVAQYQVPKYASGTASAFTNSIVMLVGLIFQPLLGMVLDIFWTGGIDASGLRLYDATTYSYAILVLPVCFVIAFLLMRFLKDPAPAR